MYHKVGEGCVGTMANMRAVHTHHIDHSTAKTHGFQPKIQSISKVVKRSYKRAYHRAITYGCTQYHGRTMTPQDFHQMTPSSPKQVASAPKQTHGRSPGTKQRVSVLTWNIGGLTSSFYTCFQEWLKTSRIDIIHLQETHWHFSSEWQTSEYNCIHSGCSTSRAGILTMVSKRLGHSDNITWQEPIPGRIVHVRVKGQLQSIDLLNLYQYVYRPSNLNDRDGFWTTMQSTLDQVPARNICIVMGDLNTSLPTTSSKVGFADYLSETGRCTGPKHKDWRKWLHIIDHYDMTVLNSWSGQHGPTFISEHGSSRIDYLCCRGVRSDILAKDVKQLLHHPMLSNSGCRHIPLTTTVISRWMPCPKQSPYFWTPSKKRQVMDHYKMQHPQWLQQMEAVADKIHTLPMDPFVHDLTGFHQIVNSMVDPGIRTQDVPSQTLCCPQTNTVFKDFLFHSNMMKKSTKATLHQVFQSWMHAAKRQVLKRQMDKVTRMNKKMKKQELFQQAHEASQAHDTRRFFGIIRKLSPKVPRKPINLRGPNGNLLGPEEAADHLRDWYHAMYSDQQISAFEPTQLHWPFEEDELSHNFLQLPAHKAVSPHYAPAPLWRSIRHVMAGKLQELGYHCITQDAVPQEWGKSTIVFLGKPGKSTSDVANLRPICLLEPCGKVLMRVLGMALRDQVSMELHKWPLFAYQPGRSTHDAIRRVLGHCGEVKQLQFMLQHRIHQTAAGAYQPLTGGLTVSLDLSRAFDQVPRGRLFESLRTLGIDETLLSFLWHIYRFTECEFEHKGCHRTFVAGRGIRQGCSAAPTLWTLFTLAILKALTQKIPESWIKSNLTLFADDTCAHCIFTSLCTLQDHLKNIGILFDTLEGYGMVINVGKTAAILKGMGSALNRANRLVVKRTPQGSFLQIPRQNGMKTLIRLKSSHLYLGIIISYHNFEKLSMDSRLAAAKKTSSIIHRWIYSRGGLTLHQKARLWYQCVYPCLSAGILAVGINSHTLATFDAYCMRSLRCIFHAPVHLDHIPHHQFLATHRLKDPLKTLHKLCKTTLQREQDRFHRLEDTDILKSWTPDHLQQCMQQLELCIQSRRQSVSSSTSVFPYCCHHCDHQFETRVGLQAHLSKTHHDIPGQLRSFRPATDLQAGLPTCKRCQMSFTTWSALKHHIEFRCNLPLPQAQATEPMELQSQFASFIEAPNELAEARSLCEYFGRYCSICLQFHCTDRSLKLHWKQYHPHEFSFMKIQYHLLMQHVSFRPTCQFCNSSDHHSMYPICPVLQNLAMLSSKKNMDVQPPTEEQAPYQCLHCDQKFKSKHGREQHYMTHHGQGPSFDVLRDQNGAFICSHCNASFKTSSSLRRHIEQGSCPRFDATRPGNIEEILDPRIIQSVRDLMPSNVLEDPELLLYMSSCCCLCRQRFERKQDLHRHLASQHAILWHEAQTTMQDLARLIRGDSHICYCAPTGTTTQSSTKQSKHRCAVFSQFGLLMHHLGVPMNEQLIKQDTNYAEVLTQAKKRRTADISPRMGPPRCTLDHYFQQVPLDRTRTDPSTRNATEVPPSQILSVQSNTSRSLLPLALPVQELSSGDEGMDDPIAADQAEQQEVWAPDVMDYDIILRKAHALIHQPSSLQKDHWEWIITADFSHLSSLMHLSNMIATLYPVFPVKLTGGQYTSLLADSSMVRFLETRCVLCDLTFQQSSDLFLHHNLAHGCIPDWSLKQFHVGLACLHQHLRTLDLPHLTDQAILQLGQLIILRLHCAQLSGHGGSGEFPADGGYMGSCTTQRSAEANPRNRTSRNRETPQGEEVPEQGKSGRDGSHTASQSDGCPSSSARGQHQVSESRHGIHGSLESRSRINPGRSHDSLKGLDQCQGESNSIETSLGGDNDRFAATEVHSSDRSPTGERTSQTSSAIPVTGQQQPLSFPQLESREKAADPIKDATYADGRSSQDDSRDQNMFGRQSSDLEVPQPEEDVHRHGQSGALPMDSEPQSGPKSMAPPTAFSLSQFLAAHTGSPSTSQSTAQSSCQEHPSTSWKALRLCVNSNGLNCYANSSCLGLAWLSQVMGVEAPDWNDKGRFQQTCFESTLLPLNVLTHLSHIMEPWLTDERLQKQHDINEFLSHLLHFLQPSFLNMEWWPKWTLPVEPTQPPTLDDGGSIGRGNKWDALTLTFPPFSISDVDCLSLQTLIHQWHDPLGMCNVLTHHSRGVVIHINRQQDTVKDLRQVDLQSLSVILPVSPTHDAPIDWIRYSIEAITYHIGMQVTSGHYRTMVRTQQTTVEGWFNYEDSKLPDQMTAPTNFQLKNLVLVWMKCDKGEPL